MKEYFDNIRKWLEINFDNCYNIDREANIFIFTGFPDSFNNVTTSYHREVIEEWINDNADEYVYTGPLEWGENDIGTTFLTWIFIEDLMAELIAEE